MNKELKQKVDSVIRTANAFSEFPGRRGQGRIFNGPYMDSIIGLSKFITSNRHSNEIIDNKYIYSKMFPLVRKDIKKLVFLRKTGKYGSIIGCSYSFYKLIFKK